MSTEQTKATIVKYFEQFWNQRRMEVADEVISKHYVDSRPVGETQGPEALKAVAKVFFDALPDFHINIEDQMAEGGKATIRWTITGTHQGNLIGVPATGKPVAFEGTTVFHVSDGKITKSWVYFDRLALLERLGALPRQ